jgi:hypothetical protein
VTTRADIAPARRRGWKTLRGSGDYCGEVRCSPWGRASSSWNSTWFARRIRDNADATCARIDAFLALDPDTRFDPVPNFYARIVAGHARDGAGNRFWP